jgi:hypothetical protein
LNGRGAVGEVEPLEVVRAAGNIHTVGREVDNEKSGLRLDDVLGEPYTGGVPDR